MILNYVVFVYQNVNVLIKILNILIYSVAKINTKPFKLRSKVSEMLKSF